MKQNGRQRIRLEAAPDWAELRRPHRVAFRDVPSLLVIDVPGEEYLEVASAETSNAIADPRSPRGKAFRQHCGLLALSYVSNN